MIQRLKTLLRQCGVAEYLICEKQLQVRELYTIGKTTDMSRRIHTKQAQVTVYQTHDGFRGDTKVSVSPEMTDAEICSCILDAAKTAAVLHTPYYEFPRAVQENPDALGEMTAMEVWKDAFFGADSQNSLLYLELFCEQTMEHIVSSWGTDVWNSQTSYHGEFALGCSIQRDVEVFREFSFDRFNPDAVAELVRNALELAHLRSCTSAQTRGGCYDVIFTDHFVHELLKMYLVRSDAEQICGARSDYQIGKKVLNQPEHPTLWLHSTRNYSDDGIPQSQIPLVKGGVLQSIHGQTKYCRRLGLEPRGVYDSIYCADGTLSLKEMTAQPCFIPLLFSDFIMYGSSGDFFGEIRLGCYMDGAEPVYVQGGSISGNLERLADTMVFSAERYQETGYDGPKAVKLCGVQIAGQER